MHREFQAILVKFYSKIVKNSPLETVLVNSLERYLNYSEFEDQKSRERDQNRSSRSGISSLSNDSLSQIKKLFHTSKIENAILFSYFLNMVISQRQQQINLVIKSVFSRLKQYEKFINLQDKKRFSSKLNKFTEDIQQLSFKAKNNCKIQWPFYEVFLEFQGQCFLFVQLLSSISQKLESEETISGNDYTNLCSALQAKCFVFDYQKKMPFQLGTGDLKLYLGSKSNTYFLETEKGYEKAINLSRKQIRLKYRPEQNEGLTQLKKYPTIKFKEEFLAEMTKLKQEYEANTTKIASLFNFKDSNMEEDTMEEEHQA